MMMMMIWWWWWWWWWNDDDDMMMMMMMIVLKVLRHRENEERRRGAVEQAVTDLLTRFKSSSSSSLTSSMWWSWLWAAEQTDPQLNCDNIFSETPNIYQNITTMVIKNITQFNSRDTQYREELKTQVEKKLAEASCVILPSSSKNI